MRFPRFPNDPDFPLLVRAGSRARARILAAGRLAPGDVAATLGASGGPKWLVLAAIDQVVIRDILAHTARPVLHLGSSIGAWRAAIFAHPQAERVHRRFLEAYLAYRHEAGDGPQETLARTRRMLAALFPRAEAQAILSGPRRLAIVTARARHPELAADSRARLMRGVARLAAANFYARPAIGRVVERVVFADPRLGPLTLHPVAPSRQVALSPRGLCDAILASSSIPFVVPPLRDPADGPPGTYWDGGIIDYHFAEPVRLPADIPPGIQLYPHFYPHLVPGWFDKPLRYRHRRPERLDDVLMLAPHPRFVRRLPMGRIPSRKDFRRLSDNEARIALWRRTVAAAEELGEALAWLLEGDRLAALLAAQGRARTASGRS